MMKAPRRENAPAKNRLKTADFAADLRAALDLRELSFMRRFDEEFTRGGGVMVYAIDSAILRFLFPGVDYDATRGGGAGDKAERAYQIFQGPSGTRRRLSQVQNVLRKTLLWNLVDGRTPTGQGAYRKLTLMPGHTTEARNLYDAIVWEFDQQRARLQSFQDAAKRVSRLVAQAKALGIARPETEEVIGELASLAFKIEDPHDKFERLNALIQTRQIMGLSAASADPDYQAEALYVGGRHVFRQTPATPTEGYLGSLSWWHNELHSRLPARYASIDREALAALDRINRSLDPSRARVVMFTDNREIIEAGRLYKPFKGTRTDELANLTFSDLYLRHPNSLLVDPAFIRPGASGDSAATAASDVDGWMRTLVDETLVGVTALDDAEPEQRTALSRWLSFRRNAPLLRSRVGDTERLRTALNNNPSLHKLFAERWADYLESLSSLYEASAPAVDESLLAIARHFSKQESSDVDHFLEQARARLRLLTERSWSTFFNTAAETGLELIDLPSLDSSVVWPVPPLFVQSDPTVADVVRKFWRPTALRRDLSQIQQRLNHPDMRSNLPANYLRALCYGLLFAHAERWPLTRLLALRALQISRQLKTQGEPGTAGRPEVTGREASFLLSVANRVTAREPEHYESARAILEGAVATQNDFSEYLNSAGEVGIALSGTRFRAEALAIDVEGAIARGANEPPDDSAARQIRLKILNELREVEKCLEPEVRLHTRILLRAEYFMSLLLPIRAPAGVKYGGDHDPISVSRSLIPDQIEDLADLYEDLANVPLRDRAALRLAAATVGQMSRLPPSLQRQTVYGPTHPAHAFAMRVADRKHLTMIERTVNDRTASAVPS